MSERRERKWRSKGSERRVGRRNERVYRGAKSIAERASVSERVKAHAHTKSKSGDVV